jgi:sugar O-acyltransferase (sialic acid O-acetyltransferase NeuD family)
VGRSRFIVVATPLVIVGAGGHGREVLDVVVACILDGAPYEFLGFLDDGEPDVGLLAALGVELLGTVDDLSRLGPVAVLLGLGVPVVRRELAQRLGRAPLEPPALVHPLASVGSRCTLGPGTIVAAGARLTTNITTGAHCYVGPNATVGHDCVLRRYATIYPGAAVSGNVRIGEAATVGAGASVRQGLTLGEACIVGLGAAVVRSVPDDATVVGSPAKRLRRR